MAISDPALESLARIEALLLKWDGDTQRERVPPSKTTQVIGGAGTAGDYLSHIIVTPESEPCGKVSIYDGANNVMTFSVGTLPFTLHLGMVSMSGAWKITTGTGVSVVAVGTFT